MLKAKAIVSETLLVGVLGLVFAIVANALSPRGLHLSRNYFPDAGIPPAGLQADDISIVVLSTTDAAIQRLRQRNLQLLSSEEVVELFHTPGYEQDLVVFIDARDDQPYTKGHIPGAYQFYHYRAEDYLPMVLPVCLNAFQVVVYCNGGECEDSEFAAVMLKDAGVPQENLFIYAGGMAEWTNQGMPVETGSRHSGEFLQPKR